MAVELTQTPEALLFEGGAGCGKTERLIERVCALIEAGTRPNDVLALAATPDAARALARRLGARGETAACVLVTTVREVALALLGTESGRAFSGRAGRLVTPMEMGFIMEDMKTSGLKNGRLKEMLKFFYRSWTELVEGAEGNENWLLPGEETAAHRLLKEVLGSTGALLEPELSALALRYLLATPDALAAARRPHVLVDDYQLLSRASQHLANLLAIGSIAVAADPLATEAVFESYPYGEGVAEFVQANSTCERISLTECHRCAAAWGAANRLRLEIDETAAPITCSAAAPAANSLTVLEEVDPAAEIAAVADSVQAALEKDIDPSSIYVATFHPAWTRAVIRALGARGIAATTPVEGRVTAGDYRDLRRCAPSRLLTALALAANANDALAWRCWCGFGDYLANSAAFADLRARADAEGEDLISLLDKASAAANAEGFPGTAIGRVVDAYRAGRALTAAVEGLEGDELLNALARNLELTDEERQRSVPLLRSLSAPLPSDARDDGVEGASAASAATLMKRVRQRMTAPAFERLEGAVLVGDSTHLTGLCPEVLLLTGFVNGLFPARDSFDATVMPPDKQRAARLADKRRLYAVVGKTNRQLVASRFSSASLADAEQLKLEIDRVRLRRGERIAMTSPSIYLPLIEPTEGPAA